MQGVSSLTAKESKCLCLSALLINDNMKSASYMLEQYRSGNNGHAELLEEHVIVVWNEVRQPEVVCGG